MTDKVKFEQIDADFQASYRYVCSKKNYKEEISLHFHPEIEILYVKKGSGYRMVGDFVESFNEGEVIFAPPNLPHCWMFDPQTCNPDGSREVLFVQFHPSFLSNGLAFFSEWLSLVNRLRSIQHGVRIVGETAEKIIIILKKMQHESSITRLTSLMKLISLLSKQEDFLIIGPANKVSNGISKNMKRMQTIVKYIMENYSEKISLEKIAAIASMSPAAFCSFFKKETGKTFTTYINEYRLGMVCSILDTFPDTKINEAAWKCGFADINYFNRYFKKAKGVSPQIWMRSSIR